MRGNVSAYVRLEELSLIISDGMDGMESLISDGMVIIESGIEGCEDRVWEDG